MRLSKIAKDFNVGIQTLVEFLEKKGGDPTMEWKPMSQVPDHLYELLSKEFNKDKSVKQASERLRLERLQTRDKIKEETRQINAVNQGIPQTRQKPAPKAEPAATPSSVAKTPTEEQLMQAAMKIVGHIDLDDQKKPAEKKAEPKPAEEKVEVKKPVEAPKTEEPQKEVPAAKVEEKKVEEKKADVVTPKAAEAKEEANKPAEKKAEPKAKEGKKPNAPAEKKPNQSIWGERSKDRINDEPLPAEARNGEVFRLNQPEQPQINVLGTIDLDSLNQSTRPKKKTKEERKKEREQKAQGATVRPAPLPARKDMAAVVGVVPRRSISTRLSSRARHAMPRARSVATARISRTPMVVVVTRARTRRRATMPTSRRSPRRMYRGKLRTPSLV